MIKITRQNWWIWLFGTAAGLLLVFGFTRAVYCNGLESSDAAGWMQAIGSIAAIIGAFRIVQIQHASERNLEIERRASSAIAERGAALTKRILALRNAIQVATQAIDAMRNAVDNARYPERTYDVDQYRERLEPIAKILDSFVTPQANHIAVLTALNISLSIAAVLGDLKRTGGGMTDQLLARCDLRINESEETLENLINLNNELLVEHNALGVDSQPV